MSSRHLSRSIVLQTLFAWDFNRDKNVNVDELLEYFIQNFAAGLGNTAFIEKLTKDVFEKREVVDKIIEKAAPEWPLEQIAMVDRNVLRIGLYELLFGDQKEVPPKVAINEAIELAKTFGGETSGKFVNGVLGTVYKEIGEPGKDEISVSPKTKEPLIKETLAGAVVYNKSGGRLKFALVHDIFGYWTLSKGKLEGDENPEEDAKREINEELGVTIKIEDKLGINEYIAFDPARGKILKSVTYFLGKTEDEELKLGDSGGLDDARWFLPENLPDLKIYDDILPFLTKAIQILATRVF